MKKRKNRHLLRKGPFVVIAFFLLIWFAGISLDEPGRVLEQAVRICLSCVGIG
ncbi:MAG: CD1871A family CXXC motif-containing protein [Desulfobulbales bacterium]|nr:CD1871A family CXXC motif-containing protein [Desulfobulbales bacterium]